MKSTRMLSVLFLVVSILYPIFGQFFHKECPTSSCPLKCPLKSDTNNCKVCDCPKGVDPLEPECGPKKPCTDTNSACYNGRQCFCNHGYIRGVKPGCVKIPTLGETCFINGSRFDCIGYGVDPNCEDTKCKCLRGFELTGDKEKSCIPNAKKLGEECSIDDDCATAYSECSSGKCKCTDGFIKSDEMCKSKSYNCPFGNITIATDKVISCQPNDKDACKDGQFCFALNTYKNSPSGHCCPNGKDVTSYQPVCPVGNPHPTGKCCANVAADGPLPKECQPHCPASTHTCQKSVCCPLPCRRNITGFFAVNDTCYHAVQLGEHCEINAQCFIGARCRLDKGGKNLICQCDDGYGSDDGTTCTPLDSHAKAQKIKPSEIFCSNDTDCGVGSNCSHNSCT